MLLAGLLAAGCADKFVIPQTTGGYTEKAKFETKHWSPLAARAQLEGFYFSRENVDSADKYFWEEVDGKIVAKRKPKDVYSFQAAGVQEPIDIYAEPELMMALGEVSFVEVSGQVVNIASGTPAIDVEEIVPVTRDRLPKLLAALKDPEPRMRGMAAQALGKIGPEAAAAAPALARAASDPSPFVRKLAVLALGGIGPAVGGAVPELVRALGDIDPYIRASAAEVLGEAGPAAKGAVGGLMNALADKDPSVRRAAVEALGRIGPDAAMAAPVLEKLFRADEEPRPLITVALSEMGPAGVLSLAKLNGELAAKKAKAEEAARKEEELRLGRLKKRQDALRAGPGRERYSRPVFLGFGAGYDIYYEGDGSFMYWAKGTRGAPGARGSLIIYGDYDGFHNFAAFTNDLVNNKFPALKPVWALYKLKYKIPY